MAVTATRTVRQVIEDAMGIGGLVDLEEAPTAAEFAKGVRTLDTMLKAWQNVPYKLWTRTSISLTLTTASTYTLSPVRPLMIHSARLKRDGQEIMMQPMTREEYDLLPNKTSVGQPSQYYYDRQREAATFYVWQQLATANGETVEITASRETEDITAITETVDAPMETIEAINYNLAVRMCHALNTPVPSGIDAYAMRFMELAEAGDREGSYWFGSHSEGYGYFEAH